MASAPDIVRIKITLDAVKPTVMRRIEAPVDVKLHTLHEMIQAIMPWGNYHGYEFHVRESRWGIPFPEMDDYGYPLADARKTTLARVLSEPDFKALRYTYDFGDDWRHTIKIERRFAAELWEEFPRLIGAKGRCPPEDVGGSWGYARVSRRHIGSHSSKACGIHGMAWPPRSQRSRPLGDRGGAAAFCEAAQTQAPGAQIGD